MQTQVVATSPHSFCLSTDTEREHECDFYAKKAGELFSGEMKSLSIPSKWFPSDTHRSIYDMNRPPSRGTEYRKSVSQYVDGKLKSSKGEVWVIDLHSFPDSYEDFNHEEVVLLILPSETSDPRTLLLIEYFKASKIKYGAYLGSTLNDIMKTSIDKGAYSILIEFNEGLSQERFAEIMDVIGRWVKEWNPEKYKVDH